MTTPTFFSALGSSESSTLVMSSGHCFCNVDFLCQSEAESCIRARYSAAPFLSVEQEHHIW